MKLEFLQAEVMKRLDQLAQSLNPTQNTQPEH